MQQPDYIYLVGHLAKSVINKFLEHIKSINPGDPFSSEETRL